MTVVRDAVRRYAQLCGTTRGLGSTLTNGVFVAGLEGLRNTRIRNVAEGI